MRTRAPLLARLALLALLAAAGCSTAPLADFLDVVRPGRLGPERVPPYGGVNAPVPAGPLVVPPPGPPPALPPPVPPAVAR